MARRLRVVAGSAGGLHLVAPRGARPTSDRVKESLFASLGDTVVDARVLDLFAGSGALGIEALSRGARSATFVDADHRAIAAIRRNLDVTGFLGAAEVVRRPVEAALGAPAGAGGVGGPFDLVFLDPPYALGPEPLAALLRDLGRDRVAPGATVVVERRTGEERLEVPTGWQVARERSHGDTLTVVLTVQGPR